MAAAGSGPTEERVVELITAAMTELRAGTVQEIGAKTSEVQGRLVQEVQQETLTRVSDAMKYLVLTEDQINTIGAKVSSQVFGDQLISMEEQVQQAKAMIQEHEQKLQVLQTAGQGQEEEEDKRDVKIRELVKIIQELKGQKNKQSDELGEKKSKPRQSMTMRRNFTDFA